MDGGATFRPFFLAERAADSFAGATGVDTAWIALLKLSHAAAHVFQLVRLKVTDDLLNGGFKRVTVQRARQESLEHVDLFPLALSIADASGFVVFTGRNLALRDHCLKQLADFSIFTALALALRTGRHVAVAHGAHHESQRPRADPLRVILFG